MLFAVFFSFLPFVVLTRMHERYLFPVLPFLLLFAVACLRSSGLNASKDSSVRFVAVPAILYACLTVLVTLNLYQVYTYYSSFPQAVPQSNRFFQAVSGAATALSILVVLSFWAFVVLLPFWLPARSPVPSSKGFVDRVGHGRRNARAL
jgi:hypothetical protein